MEFPCTGCGAELNWQPGKNSMQCPYCGSQVDIPEPEVEGEIVEHRLDDDAIRSAQKGYGTEVQSLNCGTCGAVQEVAPDIEVTQCPFCGSNQVSPESSEVIRPGSVLPFAIEANEARNKFREWISGLWFRPSDLSSGAQLANLTGVYIPAWTFDTIAHSDWTAEAGHYYYEEETYESEGETKTRRVRKTRWERADGSHRGEYDDWLVQASGGLDQAALKGLVPYNLTDLRPYDTRFLAGFRAERYKIELKEGWEIAQKEVGDKERSECRGLVPGDTQRNLKVQTHFDAVTYKHTLLPVYIAAYRYNGEVYRYIVNGQTGKAHGDAPYSKVKIGLFVAAIILALLLCFGCFGCGGSGGAVMVGGGASALSSLFAPVSALAGLFFAGVLALPEQRSTK